MVQWPRVECFAIEGDQLLQVDGMAIHSSSTRVFPKRRLRPKGFPIEDHSRKLSATVDFSYRSTFQRRTGQWSNLEELLEGILQEHRIQPQTIGGEHDSFSAVISRSFCVP
uniref:(northern house mosquito) hypothetical protein n=1 Tax=Culex pipiens TaxID=7175 RepID=A0A8D8MMB4_CULPI